MATARTKPDVLAQLREPFPAEQVKKNQDGLHYVSIDGYIGRLLDTLGLSYDFVVRDADVQLLENGPKTSSGKFQYLARVVGDLTLHERGSTADVQRVTRSGVGADVSFDADKALKTAQAEAMKKACHQFGIALELWDEDHRKSLNRQQKLAKATPDTLKMEVWKIAKQRLSVAKPTVKQIAELFGVSPSEMTEEATLRQILEDEGVL